jgi:hypothetical protein
MSPRNRFRTTKITPAKLKSRKLSLIFFLQLTEIRAVSVGCGKAISAVGADKDCVEISVLLK